MRCYDYGTHVSTQRSNEMGAILKALVASWLIRKLLPVVLVIIVIVIILIAL